MRLVEVTHKRVYIGGLSGDVAEGDILARFQPFGKVSDVHFAPHAFDQAAAHRGFAYFNFEATPSQWARCMTAYNGCKWRGSKIKVEEAKARYDARIASEAAQSAEEPAKEKRRRVRSLVRHAKKMELMTDAQINERDGWKRGRYGRAILQVSMRRRDGKLITIDPAHYKESVEKLFGSEKPLPISKLTWDISAPNQGDAPAQSSSDDDSEDSSEAGESDVAAFKARKDRQAGSAIHQSGSPARPLRDGSKRQAGGSREEATEETAAAAVERKEGQRKEKKVKAPKERKVEAKDAKAPKERKVETKDAKGPKEKMVEEKFSLSRLMGLPSEEAKTQAGGKEASAAKNGQTTVNPMFTYQRDLAIPGGAARKSTIPMSELLFDLNRLDTMKPEDFVFATRAPTEEAFAAWSEARGNLRQHYKDRVYQSRKTTGRAEGSRSHTLPAASGSA